MQRYKSENIAWHECPECQGDGVVDYDETTPHGPVQSIQTCQTCGGYGEVAKEVDQ